MEFIEKLIAEAKAAYNAAIAKDIKASELGRKLTDAERIEIRKLLGKSLALKEQADQALKDKESKESLDHYFRQPATAVPKSSNPSVPVKMGRELILPGMSKADIHELEKKALNFKLRAEAWDQRRMPTLTETLSKGMTDLDMKTLSRLTDVDGGFWVGAEVSNQIISELENLIWIRSMATIIQTNQSSFEIPTEDMEFTMARVNDNEAVTAQGLTNVAGNLRFTPFDYAGLAKIPWSLIDDVDFDLAGYLVRKYVEASARLDEALYLEGSGASEPLGLLKSGIGTTTIETTPSASSAVTAADIQGLPHKIKAQYRNNGRWVIPRGYVESIMQLRTEDGGAGLGRFMWQPNWQAGQPQILAGYPVFETEFITDIAAAADPILLFGDLTYYTVVERKTIGVTVLNELYAGNRQTGYLLDKRFDSKVSDIQAFRILVASALS